MVIVVTQILQHCTYLRLKETTRFWKLHLSASSGGAGKMGKLTVLGPSERARFNHICSMYVKVETVAACEILRILLT